MCYEISPDSLLLKTNADVKKLKEHDASKKTSKSGKASESPKMNAVKQHILCFCYQFNCTNCPICPSSPHNRSTCNCEVCECKCKASYPLNQRDRIELELHPPVRETITTSLLQRAIEILPPASVNDGILNMNNQLTMDQREQLQSIIPPPTTMLSNGMDIRTLFPPSHHKAPALPIELPCSSSSQPPPPLQQSLSEPSLSLQSQSIEPIIIVPEHMLKEIQGLLLNIMRNGEHSREERSRAKEKWSKVLKRDSDLTNEISHLLSDNLTSEGIVDILLLP